MISRICSLIVLLTLLLATACRQVHKEPVEMGMLEGQVILEDTKLPIVGASVHISGTRLGALTDLDGKYFVKNVPAGLYTLVFTTVGCDAVEVRNVTILPRLTKQVDASMKKSKVTPHPIKVNSR